MSGYAIRQAGALVPAGLTTLAERAAAEGIRIVARVTEAWGDGTERYDRPGEALLAAVEGDGNVVGIGGITECPDVDGALRVRRFYVDPDHRRHGLARALAQPLLDRALAHTSIVTCNAGASDAAAPFWEAMGFEPIETVPGITHVLRRSAPPAADEPGAA